MSQTNGGAPLSRSHAKILDLARFSDRISFCYLERCAVSRDDSAISALTKSGTVRIPGALLSCLLLGPGTSVTHQAIGLLAESGVSVCWVSADGLMFTAAGSGLTASSDLLASQARIASHRSSRLGCARAMYQMRFPDLDMSGFDIRQMQGLEGNRVREIYREFAEMYQVPWIGRNTRPKGAPLTTVNQNLNLANTLLYGVSRSVVAALGVSPGLGMIHSGHSLAFVLDIADLYKHETSIPAAFHVAANPELGVDPAVSVRTEFRRRVATSRLMTRMPQDITRLLGGTGSGALDGDRVELWAGSVSIARPGGASEDVPW